MLAFLQLRQNLSSLRPRFCATRSVCFFLGILLSKEVLEPALSLRFFSAFSLSFFSVAQKFDVWHPLVVLLQACELLLVSAREEPELDIPLNVLPWGLRELEHLPFSSRCWLPLKRWWWKIFQHADQVINAVEGLFHIHYIGLNQVFSPGS